jgi:hypothetical protein
MIESAKLRGKWFVTLYGPDGEVKLERTGHNVVTTVGKEFLASFLNSAVAGAASFTGKYIGIGTNSTAEAVGDTALGTEVSRHTGTASYLSGQIFQIKATFAVGSGTGAITEYGLFSSNSAGTLIARDTEAAINKSINDTLTVICQLTIS